MSIQVGCRMYTKGVCNYSYTMSSMVYTCHNGVCILNVVVCFLRAQPDEIQCTYICPRVQNHTSLVYVAIILVHWGCISQWSCLRTVVVLHCSEVLMKFHFECSLQTIRLDNAVLIWQWKRMYRVGSMMAGMLYSLLHSQSIHTSHHQTYTDT